MIDVLVRPVVAFEDLKRNAVVKRVGTLSIPVASIDDLIRLRTGTGRSKDVQDIEELERSSINWRRNEMAIIESTAEETSAW